MKKILIMFAIMLSLIGCQKNEMENQTVETEGSKSVTVSTSILEDMVFQLAGDIVDIEVIIPAGEDPHSYLAKPKDLQKIEKADLVLYHGLDYEGQLISALESKGYAVTENFPEEKLYALSEEDGHGHGNIDPHYWFDLDLYKLALEQVSEKLGELVPEKKDTFEENKKNYLNKLNEMDDNNRKLIAEIPQDQRYLITPHEAFNYLSKYYNIPVMAPQGIGSDSEVASKDIQETVDFIVEHKIKAIFVESTTDPARMEKLKEDCKAKGHEVMVVSGKDRELFSDSLAPKGEEGDTFIEMYEHNIKLIVENLK
ncbi:metal ABC transporter substrate-binding protein [Anaerosphaera multitolerans]|uniref:Metal transporter n=1 Tax=Anaerosphaera multitolerans TaxID=2487351 RepID=A0A437S5H1_9FIRM|nr:zinc ABC transporter substrate-binding protein [Anaerosphaera multitolerans]RVU54260.1 metal transporter [Anaerosphaera multitolerans]